MRRIIVASLRARLLVVALAAGVIVAGVVELRRAPVDVLPEFAPPTVEVQTESLGLSAVEVEQLITVPLEQDLLAGVPWLDVMRSDSVPGLSSVQMVFQPGTDLLRARQVVQERLTQAHALPNVSSPPQMLPPSSSTSRLMLIRLSSKRLSRIQLSVLARWTVRPRLLGVPGVANVSIWGQRERQLQVRVDPRRLERHHLSLFDVIETTGNSLWASPLSFLEASTPGTSGFIDAAQQRLAIHHIQPIATAASLSRIPVVEGGGKVVRLVDVADVVESHQPLIGDAVFADGPGLLLLVQKFPDADVLSVTRGVQSAIAAMRPGLPGIKIDTDVYRASSYVLDAVGNVGRTAALAFVLLFLAVLLLLFQWRVALIVSIAVALSLAAAVLVLALRGVTLNTMVLAGLVMALAVVVDDAVSDVENIRRRIRSRRPEGNGHSIAGIIQAAAVEMRGPLLFGSLVAAALVVPVFFLRGEAGAFLPSIATAYLLAVGASMVVALAVTPALGALMLGRSGLAHHGSALARRIQRRYRALLARSIGTARPAYVAVAVAAVIGLAVVPFLQRSTVPPFRDRNLVVQWHAVAGTSLPEMDRIVARAVRELRSVPGVDDVGAHVGRALMSDQVVDVNSAEMWVTVDPAANYEATVASVRRVVAGYPGLRHHVTTYASQRVEQVLGRSEPPLVVRVYGQNLRTLRNQAQRIRGMLARVDGVVHPRVQDLVEEPTLDVRVDLDAARRHGIKPGDVRRAAATLVSGTGVGSLFENQKVFDVVVWGTPAVRSSVSSIRSLLLDTPGGGHVRLGRVARVRVAPALADIHHQDVSRTLDVSAGVRGRGIGSVAHDVEQRLEGMRFPLEYHAEVVGDYAQRQAADRRFLAVAAAALVALFLLLQAAFESWRLAAMAFLALPTSLAGAAVAAMAGGRVVSIGSVAGFLAVLALAARSAVALIRRFQWLEREQGMPLGHELVLRGTAERAVPVSVTLVALALAFLPFLVSGAVAGQEVVYPMAVVIEGGLVTTGLLILFVLPALYLRFAPRMERDVPDMPLEEGPIRRADEAAARPVEPVEPLVDLTKDEEAEPVGGQP